MLCGDLEGWNGGRGEVQQGGDICIHISTTLAKAFSMMLSRNGVNHNSFTIEDIF